MENLAKTAELVGTLVFQNKAPDRALWSLTRVFLVTHPAGSGTGEVTIFRSGAYDRDMVMQALGDAVPYLSAGKIDGMDEEGSMWRYLFVPERKKFVMRGVCRFADAYS